MDKTRRIEGLDPAAPLNLDRTVQELIVAEVASSSRTDQKTNASYMRNHVPDWMLRHTARYVTIEDIEAVLSKAGERIYEASVEKLRSILHGVFEYGFNAAAAIATRLKAHGYPRTVSRRVVP